MEEPTSSAPVTVSPVESHHSRRSIISITVAIIVVALIITGVAYRNDVVTAYLLRDVHFSEAQYRDVRVQQIGLFGASTNNVAGKETVGDYASSRGVRAAILSNPDGTQEVVLLSDHNRKLTSDGLQKATLAVSPDGTTLAYAALTQPREKETFSSFTGRWTVRLVDIATGKSTDLGVGFAPEFFTRDGNNYLLYTTPTQLAVYDLKKNSTIGTDFFTPSAVDYTAHISPDGAYLAIRSAVSGKFDVFAVTGVDGFLALSPIGSIHTQLTDVEWVGSVAYGLTESVAGRVHILTVDPKNVALEVVVGTFSGSKYYRFIR